MSKTSRRLRHHTASMIHTGQIHGRAAGISNLGDLARPGDRPAKSNGHIAALTPRQAEALAYYDAGYRPAEIARAMGVKSIQNVLAMALLKAGR